MIVWDLFGGGQNSVYEALKDNPQYDVYTFDVTEPTRAKQYVLDLSNDNVLEELDKYPQPEIIVASPLCQSFSQVLTMKGGGRRQLLAWSACVGQGKKYVPKVYGGKENEETSSIPKLLIQDIFKHFEVKENENY